MLFKGGLMNFSHEQLLHLLYLPTLSSCDLVCPTVSAFVFFIICGVQRKFCVSNSSFIFLMTCFKCSQLDVQSWCVDGHKLKTICWLAFSGVVGLCAFLFKGKGKILCVEIRRHLSVFSLYAKGQQLFCLQGQDSLHII